MNIDALSAAVSSPKSTLAAEQTDRARKQIEEAPEEMASAPSSTKSVQPEELFNQIKALTENGAYSVRFENNDAQQLIVKVVDSKTNEVIRQIPPEELMELTKHLNELQGNLVDTVS